MLHLQRASAGSGKTYTLAKKFIFYFIAVRDGKGWRLKTIPEIQRGASKIIAITFTNKATAEMKSRIIDKLAALAKFAGVKSPDPEEIKKTDYLEEFCNTFKVTPAQVGDICREALGVLLNNYSDFKVSTIDSFFQTILRNFTYEVNLNDAYQVEIDSDYVASVAIDTTLNEFDDSRDSKENPLFFWLRLLMKRTSVKSQKWNIFTKNPGKRSVYGELRETMKRLESEDYKGKKERLESYFDGPDAPLRLANAFLHAKEKSEHQRRELTARLKRCRDELAEMLAERHIDAKTECVNHFAGHLAKIEKLQYDTSPKSKLIFKPAKVNDSLAKKGVSLPDDFILTAKVKEMYDLYNQWLEADNNPLWKHWRAYEPLLPMVGLMMEVRNRMQSFLESNNLVQLADTSTILSSIIDRNSTSFVYERLGSVIDHYLIDEFQDTSGMQWEILYPLVEESNAVGNDNLIIGDAKQSIYRFRNARPQLITTEVPRQFSKSLKEAGLTKDENTNWRSQRIIVEFNNALFKVLSEVITEISESDGLGFNFSDLYGNVEQYSHHREDKGYVEINFIDTDDSGADDADDEEKDMYSEKVISSTIGIVLNAMERGYAMKDIAVLVDTNQQGKMLIESLVQYNSERSEDEKPIEFISEESLLISSSQAVTLILSVLEKISEGKTMAEQDSEESLKAEEEKVFGKDDGRIRWSEIKSDFTFFALRHTELSMQEKFEKFLLEENHSDEVGRMLDSMQSQSLTAIVEASVENFVPDNLKHNDAPFIAAFQDLVLDFCERGSADPASFLEWWNKKGKNLSISSPEGVDAINIMTVHKSKGLEFKCVIVPFAGYAFTPPSQKTEWRWVDVYPEHVELGLPEILPVLTNSSLMETIHEDVYREFVDLYMMDKLNSLYVAFTRARDELYIFTKNPKRPGKNLSTFLKGLTETDNFPIPDDCSAKFLPTYDPELNSLWIGEPAKFVESKKEEKRGDFAIENYDSHTFPGLLDFVEKEEDYSESLVDDDEDPRSEGNVLHAIMALVRVRKDLDRAMLVLQTRGLFTKLMEIEWRPLLEMALDSCEASEWFTDEWIVLNERSFLQAGKRSKRPDRILISKDRKRAVIIDYKFGENREDEIYSNQVRGYMDILHKITGISDISGYVWYMRSNEIFPIK